MEAQAVIKQFLEKIKEDIELIDGGCKDCISIFCEGVNTPLADYKLKLVFTEKYPIRVNIVEI